MLYTDTDAFILSFKSQDLYKEINDDEELRNMFDLSGVPIGHPSQLSDPEDPRGGEVGFFKEECSFNPIIEFVGLRPKMYSIKVWKQL